MAAGSGLQVTRFLQQSMQLPATFILEPTFTKAAKIRIQCDSNEVFRVFSLTDCLLMRKISSHSLLQGKSYEFILIKRCSCPTPLTKAAKPCSNIWRLSTERQKPPELNKKNSQVQGDTEIFTNRTISPKKRLSLSRTEKRVSTLT